ncbi:MAG: polysaccharide deacetylase family protein [Xanthobacteraceae bacterium]|jgi:peptidoglycan/xylan/chitin deacetylase (PgdA/CDA1 family)
MRFVVIIVAALMSLGLAAFGVVSAQKAAAPAATSASPVRVASLNTPVVPVRAPVSQIAQATTSDAPATAGPTRVAQTTPTQSTPAPSGTAQNKPAVAAATPSAGAAPATNIPACDKPGGMGLSRIVEIDTTGGPGFGFEHFKQYDFLRDKEIVLTFDDGPWPENTMAVVKALTDECLKATFFEIGKHAVWHPEITKQVLQAGMTVGTHTWSHKDLARNPYAKDIEQAEQEIEMGNSAVYMAAAGAPIAPFFRFPDLQHPPQMLAYLGQRDIAIFSTDIDSFDFKLHKPEQVIKSVMTKLEKRGKGIILMHDFQHATAEAIPELLHQLKASGYKVVHMVPKQPLTTIAKYDEMVTHQDKLSSNNTRPEASVVRTIGQ